MEPRDKQGAFSSGLPCKKANQRMERETIRALRRSRLPRAMVVGIASGLVANAATAVVDRLVDPLVSVEQKRRERAIRAGSPHALAGPHLARIIAGHALSKSEEDRARVAFGIGYGILWGLVYAFVRSRVAPTSRLAGLRFAFPFYLLCDGVIAPLLGLSPTIAKVPWQLDAKELTNHIAWTAAAETVHRLDGKLRS